MKSPPKFQFAIKLDELVKSNSRPARPANPEPEPSKEAEGLTRGVRPAPLQASPPAVSCNLSDSVPDTTSKRISYDALSSCSIELRELRTPPKQFKKQSSFSSQSALKELLESKSRISINGETGHRDFVFQNHLKPNENRNFECNAKGSSSKKASRHRIEGSPSLLPPRPNQLVWQLPYPERMHMIEKETAKRISKLRIAQLLEKTSSHRSNESSHLFKEASHRDADFDFYDDHIDEQEECGGASRAVKFSIRCLDFNNMI